MKDFFNSLGKKKEDLTDEERKSRALLTLGGYGIVFVLIIIIGFIGSLDDKNTNNNYNNLNNQSTTTLTERYEALKENNFDSDISLIKDTDILLIGVRRENINKELIMKRYKDQTNYYYTEDNTFYEINQELTEINKIDEISIYNDFDTTFLNIENILALVKDESNITLTEENYYIERYKIDETKALNIYNTANSTAIITDKDFTITVDIHYNENIEKIVMDLTDIYNVIKGTAYTNVSYSMTFSDINNITIPDLKLPE